MFYKSIAKVYDHIFPQNKQQLEFINAIREIKEIENILDIGCATGNLTELLNSQSNHVTGLDLDHQLLEVAQSKHPEMSFVEKNMLEIDTLWQDGSLDRIISFGNTLVHLPNRKTVMDFFKVAYKVLKHDGLFIVQIINYDRIIDQNIDNLPTIDNEYIKFIRKYKLSGTKDFINFDTQLLIKSSGQELVNSIPLLTLREHELENMLTAAGFKNVTFYGNLKGDSITDDAIPLLFSCSK